LYKFDKNDQLNQNKESKAYSFPHMSVGAAVTEKKEIIANPFRRIYFDDESNDCHPKHISNGDAFDDIKTETKFLEEHAYREGFKKGEKDGLESVRDRFDSIIKSFRESVDSLEKAKKSLRVSAEQEAVELALAIAKKILYHDVSINRDVILNIAKAALKKVVDRKRIKIRLAPSDFHYLSENKAQLGIEEDFEKVKLEEDQSITGGGCIIETNLGDIDARIESQLHVVEEAFRSEIKRVRGK